MEYRDNPYGESYSQQTDNGASQSAATARITGPVTDPNDPRLSDPSYASDPDVLEFLNARYGPGGTAFNPPAGTPGWNPNTQAWNPGGDGGGGGGGGNGGGGGAGSGVTPFAWPGYTPPAAPTLTPLGAPTPYSFTPFSYDRFHAPTLDEAKNAPGYQFGLQQGQDSLLNAAARMGVARGGGTLKDLFGYTNAAAEQNYGNVFNQDLQGYNTNRDTAFNSWAANNAAGANAWDRNYGASKDVNASQNQTAQDTYANLRQNAADVFNPQFDAAKMSFSDLYQRWLGKLNSLTTIAGYGAA